MSTPPPFTYFADPVGAKVFVESEETCQCCAKARGWIYDGTMYGRFDDEPVVCPWCIADGTVARVIPEASFNSLERTVDEAIRIEAEERTPGFPTWQDLQWPCCCDDACVFRGHAQYDQLTKVWSEALDALRSTYEAGLLGTETFEEFLEMFKNECDPGAYAFQCRHCKKWQVPWDMS